MYTLAWLIPLLAGALILGACGWRREMQRRKESKMRSARATAQQLPEGAAPLFAAGDAREAALRGHLIGAFMLVAVGTYGTNQLQRLLQLLYHCRLEQLVGSILVIENDAVLRTRFAGQMPPTFGDRIVYGYADEYAGGMAGRTVEWALERVDSWGVPLERAAQAAIDLHLRRNGNRNPSDVLAFLSMGGHAPLGLLPLEAIHQRFDESQLVAFTSLPRHTSNRTRFAQLKAAYEELGVHGWVLQDNLGPAPVTADFGMVACIVGLAEAALYADHATALNNAFSLTLSDQPGSILIYEVVASSLAGYPYLPDPAGPRRYYVPLQPLVALTTKLLRNLDAGRGLKSAELPAGVAGSAVFDIVLQNVVRDYLAPLEDDVRAGRRLHARVHGHNGHLHEGAADYETVFASIASAINPERPVCPLVAVRLRAVDPELATLDELVKPPASRQFSVQNGASSRALSGLARAGAGTASQGPQERSADDAAAATRHSG